jgi:hypothetical protein
MVWCCVRWGLFDKWQGAQHAQQRHGNTLQHTAIEQQTSNAQTSSADTPHTGGEGGAADGQLTKEELEATMKQMLMVCDAVVITL